ncbi:hypothetical protein P5673_002643 [Acropora cervicornis]|uniref:Uncharacterized protein n=1 Tax=Acropora cervicornis TaxID=6130 RepID=A0AAD9VF88_ACRCE|nr:hypothetical protein P5673_002643 [Acropora cervicornis]
MDYEKKRRWNHLAARQKKKKERAENRADQCGMECVILRNTTRSRTYYIRYRPAGRLLRIYPDLSSRRLFKVAILSLKRDGQAIKKFNGVCLKPQHCVRQATASCSNKSPENIDVPTILVNTRKLTSLSLSKLILH